MLGGTSQCPGWKGHPCSSSPCEGRRAWRGWRRSSPQPAASLAPRAPGKRRCTSSCRTRSDFNRGTVATGEQGSDSQSTKRNVARVQRAYCAAKCTGMCWQAPPTSRPEKLVEVEVGAEAAWMRRAEDAELPNEVGVQVRKVPGHCTDTRQAKACELSGNSGRQWDTSNSIPRAEALSAQAMTGPGEGSSQGKAAHLCRPSHAQPSPPSAQSLSPESRFLHHLSACESDSYPHPARRGKQAVCSTKTALTTSCYCSRMHTAPTPL
jgi:hypothetical protein